MLPGVSNTANNERAMRAVKAFRAMQHTFTGFAQAMTGDPKVRVEVASGPPRTDGRKILFRPPIALGDNISHDREVCDRRDPVTKKQLCPACCVREEVLISIFHEIAHISYGTFEAPKPGTKRRALQQAVEDFPQYEEKIRSIGWQKINQASNHLELAGLINPFLPTLVNALEDARVDERMFEARPGTRAMFDGLVYQMLAEGIEEDDGTISKWSDRPLNSQIMIGVFALVCGYDYTGWFDPEIEAALSDKTLRDLSMHIPHAKSVGQVFSDSLGILERLRELGFCRLPEEQDQDKEEPQPEENDEQEAADEEQDDS